MYIVINQRPTSNWSITWSFHLTHRLYMAGSADWLDSRIRELLDWTSNWLRDINDGTISVKFATRILIRTYQFRITNKNSSAIRQFGLPEPLTPLCGNLELRVTKFEKHSSMCPKLQETLTECNWRTWCNNIPHTCFSRFSRRSAHLTNSSTLSAAYLHSHITDVITVVKRLCLLSPQILEKNIEMRYNLQDHKWYWKILTVCRRRRTTHQSILLSEWGRIYRLEKGKPSDEET